MSNLNFGPMVESADEAEGTPKTITLPMKGADGKVRKYVIGEGTGIDMLRLWAVQAVYQASTLKTRPTDGDAKVVDAMSQQEMFEMSLGADVTAAVMSDGVPIPTVRRAVEAATAFRLGNLEAAKAVWSGKVPTKATRSAKTGGAGSKTKRASTSGTSTPKKSSNK